MQRGAADCWDLDALEAMTKAEVQAAVEPLLRQMYGQGAALDRLERQLGGQGATLDRLERHMGGHGKAGETLQRQRYGQGPAPESMQLDGLRAEQGFTRPLLGPYIEQTREAWDCCTWE